MTVTDPGSRKRILRQTGKCFVCLKTGHIGASCTSNIKCTQCMGKHHLAICDAHLKSTVSESPTQANNRKTDTGVRQSAPNSGSSHEISGAKVN